MSAAILAERDFPHGRRFQVVRCNLLEEPVEAIVNAANGHLAHGGGVAGVIARAAGSALQAESDRLVREHGPLQTGAAAVTTAGKLPFKGVIHAVGPRYGEGDEEKKLERALSAAFRCAHEAGWRSVSFPAVSAGIFAVPLEICARSYVAAVRAWFETGPRGPLALIRLCLREQPVIDAVLAELKVTRA
ncbi:MAG: macro domain-containing protein [Betaproteobacteria bacterium]|nr:macro domain-containing protein [Betaproteobacteria bacterium]